MYATDLEKLGIDLKGKTSGTHKIKCPKCNGKGYDLSVNINEGLYKCHKSSCGWSGRIRKPLPFRPIQKKEYVLPVWTNNTSLSENAVKWFSNRGISQKTLISAKISEGLEYMPQKEKKVNTIQFNYFREGILINSKFRTGDKCFKMVKDAELIFFNLDGIKDQKEIIITEGEMDALSFIEIGLTNVVSVPNGASKGNQQLEYLDNCIDYFEQAEKIVLATDQDEAGYALRDELIRRLGVEVCFKVDFVDCKDANEYLVKYGAIALEEVVKNAREIPVEGIITVEDLLSDIAELYEGGLKKGQTIGLNDFDELISWIPGQLTMITGIPNQGKSEFLDFILSKLAIQHGWKFGIFSPENFPLALHVSKLAEKVIGKSFMWGNEKMNVAEVDLALNFINEHYFFIRPKDEDFTLDNILEKAKYLVKKKGINGLVIDPWNTIEHHYTTSETQYVSKVLARLTAFKQRYNIHIFLVAHPTKMRKDKNSGKYEIPTLYDISGSANFFNKADNGITVYRDFIDECTRIFVQKVKFKHIGKQGMAEFRYNIKSGRYTPFFAHEDNDNWLNKPQLQMEANVNFENEAPF
jgi:twinkle protein